MVQAPATGRPSGSFTPLTTDTAQAISASPPASGSKPSTQVRRPKGPPTSTTIASNIPLSARRSERLDMNTVERKGKVLVPANRTHVDNIPDAPTFKPTEEEWKDPMEYIKKISAKGAQFGIAKIIPPENWNPDFVVDTERFHFKTRKQELNSVEGGTRSNLNYLDQLSKFHRSHGANLHRFPSVDKRPLNLYELKKAVESRGGFERVCKGKKWAEIGRDLGYSGKIMSSLSTSLKNSYAKWLDPYEQWLRGAKPNVQMQLEHERGGPYGTPSPAGSPMKRSSAQQTPSSVPRDSPAMQASHALNDSMASEPMELSPEARPAPTSGFTAANAGGFKPMNAGPSSFTAMNTQQSSSREMDTKPLAPAASINGNDTSSSPQPATNGHGGVELKRSHSEIAGADTEPNGESPNRRSKRARKGDAPTVTGSNMTQPRHSTPRLLAARDRSTYKPGDICEVCGKGSDDKNILICEGCYCGYHTYCLDPPLAEIPENDWHCQRCLVGTGEFGFEEGGIYSLRQFQEKAYYFKERHFAGRQPFDPVINGPQRVSEDDVEKEFWRLVSSITETVEVEYGADVHSTTHGSAFPTIERHPRNTYSFDAWNLNNLPLNQESLFRHIKSDISGMTVPWLYVGMCFSTFCWHNEDHYTYSANYQHFGATKTWYGIPASDTARFEEAMRETVPELFESQPDLLFQLVTLLPPHQLTKKGIRVYAIDQRAGQLVITFPQAYHCGFNHGFNFNEAVNFAPSDWEPFGRAGVERLREFRRQPCFSHDELLLTAAAGKDVSIKTAKWLAPALQETYDKEKANRHAFESQVKGDQYFSPSKEDFRVLRFERETDTDDLPEDEYVCNYCKAYCYLSRFRCSWTKKIACLDHVEFVNCCQHDEGHSVHVRLSLPKLEQTVQKIWDKARIPEAWTEKFETTIAETDKPQLKSLRSLLSEGERIPWDLPQLPHLREFVERCNEWVEEATNYITRKQQNRRKNEKLWRKNSQVKIAEIEEREKEQRKLDNIKKLLDEADRIGFDCAEISTLQERSDAIAAFQADAREALKDIAAKTTTEIEELIEVGKGFFLEIPEVEHLEKVARQMRWHDTASERGQSRTLQEVSDLIDQASELNVPEYNEHLQFLRDQKHRGELWESKAKELMAVENVHFAQLDSFSKQAADLPVSKETLAAIDAILKKQREAQERILTLVERSRNPDLRQRPTYKEVKEVMDSLYELNSKPTGTVDLEKEQKRHEDWMRRGKKLFGKTNAPLHILLQHMEIVDARNKACFDLSDKPRMPVEPSSRSNTPEPTMQGDSTSNRDVFCLCRSSEAGLMIECMVCHEWYHSKCLKIARGKVKEDDDFTCPICDHRVKIPRDAARPKIEELISLQAEIATLPFQPDEEAVIKSIVDTAQAFRDYMQNYIQKGSLVNTMEEVPTQRFYLRKIEGADILLTEETNFFRQELYRFVPIAPEPPPFIEVSGSTRKPRPTKQQKLMKEMGISNPEDLPVHLRTKPYQAKKRHGQDDAKSPDASSPGSGTQGNSQGQNGRSGTSQNQGSSGATPTTLNFRPPLTATAFPQRSASSSHQRENSGQHEHPQLADGPFYSTPQPDNPFAGPSGATSTLAPLGSPFGAGTTSSPTHNPNFDPSLFSSSIGMDRYEADESRHMDSFNEKFEERDRDSNRHSDLYSPQKPGQNEAIDEMFADFTNQDDDADTSGTGQAKENNPADGKASGDAKEVQTSAVDPALL